MADDAYDPFEEEPETGHKPPRVNLGYQAETRAQRARRTVSLALGPNALLFFVKVVLVIFIMLAYPVMAVQSHKLDDSPVILDDSRHWAVQDIGASAVLIARELDGPGWTTDRHPWHPQSRLTALPAWQESLLEALADHGRLIISEIDGPRDQDLIAATRLLDPAEGQDMTPRLIAASEALANYDDRVAGGVVERPSGAEALIAKLHMTSGWASARHAELVAVASPGDGWIASREAVETVYSAKAQAHVAYNILAATGGQEASLLSKYEIETDFTDALRKWQRAASLRPLFVSNQGGDGFIGANHPAIMAFRINEARLASLKVADRLAEPAPGGNLDGSGQTVGRAPQ